MRGLKEEERLSGVDNYAMWNRLIQATLGEEGLIDHIAKGESALALEVEEDDPLSVSPTAAETSKLRVALRQFAKDRAAVFSILCNGVP